MQRSIAVCAEHCFVTFAKKQPVMTKLLIWGIVIYFVYRWVQQKTALNEGPHRQNFQDNRKKEPVDEGEYIDYEELK